MVIYSHLEYCNHDVMRFFSPMFLTTFFFVSGYLFREGQSFGTVFEQRTRTLLWPVLSLGSLMIVMSHTLSFKSEVVSWQDAFIGLLAQNGQNQLLWFVAALYVYSIIFYWIERWSGNVTRLLYVGLLLFVLNTAYSWWLGLSGIPWHVASVGYASFYMALGKWYKHNESTVDARLGSRMLLLLLCVYILLITVFDLHISFEGSVYMVDALAVSVIGLVIIVYISKHWFRDSKFLLFVGANTLFYFAFHGKVYSLLQTICHKTVPPEILYINGIQDTIAFCIVVLDAIILILPTIIVNRYFAIVLGKGYRLWKT